MACHICSQEAVGRCFNCGQLFCADHGSENCTRCDTALKAGDPRQDRVSRVRLHDMNHAAWWRPRQAEEYSPPACYQCRGIARNVCINCGDRYCAEHAGVAGICAACGQSSQLGLFILFAVAAVFGVMVMLNFTR